MKNIILALFLLLSTSPITEAQTWVRVDTLPCACNTAKTSILYDNELYVGTTPYITIWDSISWDTLKVGNIILNAMADFNGELYVAGDFDSIGGIAADNIAKWDGQNWSPVGGGVSAEVLTLEVYGSRLYAGGHFTDAYNLPLALDTTFESKIAAWDGVNWHGLVYETNSASPFYNWSGLFPTSGYVSSLHSFENELYIGGIFGSSIGGGGLNNMATYNTVEFSAVGLGANGNVNAATDYLGEIYFGGNFTTMNGSGANYIGAYDDFGGFYALGSGMDMPVHTLAIHDNDLYAGGDFFNAGGTLVNHVARWDGFAWKKIGAGMNGNVQSLITYNNDLYAIGGFNTADGNMVEGIAKLIDCDPVATFTFSDSLCVNTNVVFNNTSSDTTSYDFTWMDGSFTFSHGKDTANRIFDAVGVYDIHLIAANGICTDTMTRSYTVNPEIIVNAGKDTSLCLGDTVKIGNVPLFTGGSPVGQTVFYWNHGQTLHDSLSLEPFAFPATTTNYRATVMDMNGCTGIDYVQVEVFDKPQVSAGLPDTICYGDSVEIGGFPTVIGGTPPYDIHWSPASHVTDPNAQYPKAFPPTTTVFEVFVQDNSTCTGMDSVEVFVWPELMADPGNDTMICKGDTISIGGNPSAVGGAGSGYDYYWNPIVHMDNPHVANPKVNPQVSTFYSLTVVDGFGCDHEAEIHVQIDPVVADAGGGFDKQIEACFGAITHLGGAPTASEGIMPFAYNWTPVQPLDFPNVSNPEVTTDKSRMFWLTVTDSLGCKAKDSVMLTVDSLPEAYFSYEQVDAEVMFEDSSERTDHWLWLFGDGDSSNLQHPVHEYLTAGTYEVILFASNSCGTDIRKDTVEILTNHQSSITLDPGLQVYPNPYAGSVNISFSLNHQRQVSLQMLDMTGKQVKILADGVAVAGTQNYTFSAAAMGLPAGIYLLHLTINGHVFTRKLVEVNR